MKNSKRVKKNWNILWQLVIAPITHSMVRNFHFSIKFQFFYQKIQLSSCLQRVKTRFLESMDLTFFVGHVGGCNSLHALRTIFLIWLTCKGLKDRHTFLALSHLKNEYIWKSSISSQKYIPFKCRNCQTVIIVLLTDKCPQLNPIFEIRPCNVYLLYVQPCCCRPHQWQCALSMKCI